jgi:hypothetical protein
MNYTILRDTQEKKGWIFSKYKSCLGTVDQKLPTGDYTIDGLEHLLCIERKGTVSELAMNVHEERFDRELVRMEEFEYPFIILEFSMEDLIKFPAQLPKNVRAKIKYTGYYLLRKVINYQLIHPKIHILFCGRKGKDVASSIFKRVLEQHGEA